MKSVFVECKCRKTAKKRCPWAAVIAKVDGGYHAFESWQDYQTWRKQK